MDYNVLAAATDNHACRDIAFIVKESARLCFEETLDRKLDGPAFLSLNRLMVAIKAISLLVSDAQRKEYSELKTVIENKQTGNGRKR